MPLTSGTTEYSLPSDQITVVRVTINDSPVVERTFSFLDDSNSDWIKQTGVPENYYIRVDSSIVAGVAKESIGFNPISTFSALVVVQYLARPDDLSADGDIPFGGSSNGRLLPFHHGLAFYATYRGFLTMGLLSEAGVYLNEWNSLLTIMEATNKTRTMFNPNFRGILLSPTVQSNTQ